MAKIVIVGPAFPLRGGIANFNEALARPLLELPENCLIAGVIRREKTYSRHKTYEACWSF